MKTSHQFARELLAGPELPIFHFDPSCAGFDPEDDTSISEPEAQIVELRDEDGYITPPFITIVGHQREENNLDDDQ